MDNNNRINAAIAYDFDGTLVPGYMHDYGFFEAMGIEDSFKEFWPEVTTFTKEHDMDEVLSYMHYMLHVSNYKRVSIHKDKFIEYGKNMQFFNGVATWFERINAYAANLNINLKHYIISSGLREIIQGSSIAKHFSCIYASGFVYNQDGVAIWPALSVNYTNKTQYIYRINKGIENSWNHKALNTYMPSDQKPIPAQNIIYFGDGETDIPAMKTARSIGGNAIAVYDQNKPNNIKVAKELVAQKRANFALNADYCENSDIDKAIKNILNNIKTVASR